MMEMKAEAQDFMEKHRHTATVSEGKAEVNFPSSLDVFYNPVQEFNRDLSVAVLRLFASDYKLITDEQSKKYDDRSKHKFKIIEDNYKITENNTTLHTAGKVDSQGITILEALAASGLRSIRYAREVGGVKNIVANDISESAIECMKANLEKNSVAELVTPSLKDASLLLQETRQSGQLFGAVDLDPYGSPHKFLDGAVQAVADGGLLLVTCTDMAVLCGVVPETCFIKYGCLPIKTTYCHEMALRIVLQCINSHANKYGRYIVPLISLSADFYVRLFVRVFTSQKECKKSVAKLGWLHICNRCESTEVQPLGLVTESGCSVKYQPSNPSVGSSCIHCGGIYRMAGPVWIDKIHDINFIRRLKTTLMNDDKLSTHRRIYGTLTMMEEELPTAPFYYIIDKVAKVLRMSTFKRGDFMNALFNAGYEASPTHCCPNAIKTNAPVGFIWDIMRARNRLKPVLRDKYPVHHPALQILYGQKSRRNLKVDGHHELRSEGRNLESSGNKGDGGSESADKPSSTETKDGMDVQPSIPLVENSDKIETIYDGVNDNTLILQQNMNIGEEFRHNIEVNNENDLVLEAEAGLIHGQNHNQKEVSFEPNSKAQFQSDNLLRFQINPRDNWGPKARAVTSIFSDTNNKSKLKQGRRKMMRAAKRKQFEEARKKFLRKDEG